MYPYLFSLGPLQIRSYGFMMASGFVAGLLHWIWLGRDRGYTRATCTDLMIWVMLSGIIGARAAFVLENLHMFMQYPANIFRMDQGGLVFYGGLSAASIAVVIFSRWRKLAFVPLVDFTLTAVPLSHAFGRVGCFLNSCCFGSRCVGGSCGVAFPRFSLPWHAQVQAGVLEVQATASLPVHPVQLYEAGFNVLLYFGLLFVFRWQRRPGFVTSVYFMAYAVGRFGLEFFRGDHAARAGLAGFSPGQIVSLPLLLVGFGMYLVLWGKLRRASRAVGAGV